MKHEKLLPDPPEDCKLEAHIESCLRSAHLWKENLLYRIFDYWCILDVLDTHFGQLVLS